MQKTPRKKTMKNKKKQRRRKKNHFTLTTYHLPLTDYQLRLTIKGRVNKSEILTNTFCDKHKGNVKKTVWE